MIESSNCPRKSFGPSRPPPRRKSNATPSRGGYIYCAYLVASSLTRTARFYAILRRTLRYSRHEGTANQNLRAPPHLRPRFFLGRARLGGLALIVQLLALGYRDFALDLPFLR